MANNLEKTPAETLADSLDEINWRAIAALAQLRIEVPQGAEGFVIIAKLTRGAISAETVPASWGTFVVDVAHEDVSVSRACSFCARSAVGIAEVEQPIGAGGSAVFDEPVCGRCAGSRPLKPLP